MVKIKKIPNKLSKKQVQEHLLNIQLSLLEEFWN